MIKPPEKDAEFRKGEEDYLWCTGTDLYRIFTGITTGTNVKIQDLPRIKREENIDFVITNGENSAGGMGINERNFNDMLRILMFLINLLKIVLGLKEKLLKII